MTKAWFGFCMAIAVPAAKAEVATLAWHFPESPEGLFGHAIGRAETLSEPPAATVFRSKGDRMIDLSRDLRTELKSGDGSWLVWNETRHLLVARAEASVLYHVEKMSGFPLQPQMAAITLDWYQTLDPDLTTKPVARLDVQGRSGQLLSSGWEQVQEAPVHAAISSIHLKGEPQFGDEIDTGFKFTLKWTERAGGVDWRWSMESAVTMEDVVSKPVLLLKANSPSGSGWTVFARAQRRLMDGTPLSEARWMEEKGKAVAILPWKGDEGMPEEEPIGPGGGKLRLRVLGVDPSILPQLLSADAAPAAVDSGSPADPFATEAESAPVEDPLGRVKTLVLPAPLVSGMPGTLLDVTELLRARGIYFSEGGFVGFDPWHYKLFAASASETELDKVQALATCPNCYNRKNLAIRLQLDRQGAGLIEQHGISFTARSGQRAILTCQQEEPDPRLKWMIEPTLGDGDDLVDLRQECRLPPSMAGSSIEARGCTTLATGAEQPFQSADIAGTKTTLSLKVDIEPQ